MVRNCLQRSPKTPGTKRSPRVQCLQRSIILVALQEAMRWTSHDQISHKT
jgi:hypothetical protein